MGLPGGPGQRGHGEGPPRPRLRARDIEQVDALAEFPRIGDRRIGRKHRCFHVVASTRPSSGTGTGADDGYLLFYMYDPAELTTDLLILRADDVAGEPAATLRMPQRVPFGLHGNWVAVA